MLDPNEPETVYEKKGYQSREDYLEQLSEDYDVPLDMVIELSELLTQEEDFDGLLSALNDYSLAEENL